MSAKAMSTRSLGGPEEEFDRLRAQVSATNDKIRDLETALKRMATELPTDYGKTLLTMSKDIGGLRKNQSALADAMHELGTQLGQETSTQTIKGRLEYAAVPVMKGLKEEGTRGLRAMSAEGRRWRDALANWKLGLIAFLLGLLMAVPLLYGAWLGFRSFMPEEARITHARIAFDANARYTAMRVLADKYAVRPVDMFSAVIGAAQGDEVLEECRAQADAVGEIVACSLPIEVSPSSYSLGE